MKKNTGKKVLVVDDDDGIRDAVSLILEEEGYIVACASRGEEIYDAVQDFKPDIILLDVLISGSDGRILCRQLKQKEESKNIPVIMISAHPSAAAAVQHCGADMFVAKPFDLDTLLDALSRYVHN
jgi:DNA-binding response OmpR family regulator